MARHLPCTSEAFLFGHFPMIKTGIRLRLLTVQSTVTCLQEPEVIWGSRSIQNETCSNPCLLMHSSISPAQSLNRSRSSEGAAQLSQGLDKELIHIWPVGHIFDWILSFLWFQGLLGPSPPVMQSQISARTPKIIFGVHV